jgi:hypothetical protein
LEVRPKVGAPQRFKPEWMRSPDVAEHHGPPFDRYTPSSDWCRFDVTVPMKDAAEVCGGTLWCVFEDNSVAQAAILGDPVRTPTQALIETFFHAVNDMDRPSVLEIGSRARSGITRRHLLPEKVRYLGCDIKAGPNVDLVCDAHSLASAMQSDQFDAVMAFSVLEHLLMPWKFVLELNKVMKQGAVGLFTTHQSWPIHDDPWDFWRFSDQAWNALLNYTTGFEIVSAAMGEPAYIVAAHCHSVTNFGPAPSGFLASNVTFRKISNTQLQWPADISAIVNKPYPA